MWSGHGFCEGDTPESGTALCYLIAVQPYRNYWPHWASLLICTCWYLLGLNGTTCEKFLALSRHSRKVISSSICSSLSYFPPSKHHEVHLSCCSISRSQASSSCHHLLSVINRSFRSNIRTCSHPAAKLQTRKGRTAFSKNKSKLLLLFL